VRPGRSAAVVMSLAVVAGGGYAAWAQASEPAASYRTATVTRGDVEQLLDLTGTLGAAGTDELAFGTSGTVAAVEVTAGQRVHEGQLLGALDRTALRTTAQRARADVAAAGAQLERDEDAQADQVAESSSSSSQSATAQQSADPTFEPSTGDSSHDGAGDVADPSDEPDPLAGLAQEQDAVTAAQTAATQALAAAREALVHQNQVCAQAFTAEPATTPSDQPSDAPTAADPGTDPDDQACTDALAAVQDAQQKAADAQDTLQTAVGVLSQTLSQAAATLQTQSQDQSQTTQDQPSTSEDPQPSQQGSQQAQPTGGSEAGQQDAQQQTVTVTAATLARDQAGIEQAKAQVVTADAALDGAVLRAPHAGRVVQVAAEKGGSASAGTTAFVVVSPGLTTLTTSVTDTQLRSLAVGQAATVTPVGSAHGYDATVSYLDPVPDTSTDATTYTVTVTLARRGLSLPNGGPASASVVVGTATDVLTVPTSAVSSGAVERLRGGDATRTRVTAGIVGTTRTEISVGLSAGDEVVIADLGADLPSADDQQEGFRGGNGGVGGFGRTGPVSGGVGPPGAP
jgi:HlyD family secretion protein